MLLASLLMIATITPGDPPTPDDIVSAMETATIRAIDRARPSVVAIARVRGEEPEKTTAIKGYPPVVEAPVGPDNRPQKFDYAAPGDFSSGVVIGPDNAILTTYHTLRGSAQIWVRTADRQEFQADILAADPRSDLAVIVPRATGGNGPKLIPMPIADAETLRPGSFLLTLGNPYNAARDGKASAGMGILSNTARRLHTPVTGDITATRARALFFQYQPTLLQLDAKLNLGMSGGAVVNMRGELVGLTSAAASPVSYDVQAGYAIPMDVLGRRAVDALRKGKEVEYGFLGIVLSDDPPNGVSRVPEGTPAARAELLDGDVIVAVGGRKIDAEDGLTMALAVVPVGQDVKLTIRRNGMEIEKTIFVSKYPVQGQVIATSKSPSWRGLRVDYASVLANSGAFDFNTLSPMALGGLVVTEVEPDSPAARADIKKNQVISEVNGRPIPTPAEFAKAVSALEGKEIVLTLPNPGGFGEKKVSLPK